MELIDKIYYGKIKEEEIFSVYEKLIKNKLKNEELENNSIDLKHNNINFISIINNPDDFYYDYEPIKDMFSNILTYFQYFFQKEENEEDDFEINFNKIKNLGDNLLNNKKKIVKGNWDIEKIELSLDYLPKKFFKENFILNRNIFIKDLDYWKNKIKEDENIYQNLILKQIYILNNNNDNILKFSNNLNILNNKNINLIKKINNIRNSINDNKIKIAENMQNIQKKMKIKNNKILLLKVYKLMKFFKNSEDFINSFILSDKIENIQKISNFFNKLDKLISSNKNIKSIKIISDKLNIINKKKEKYNKKIQKNLNKYLKILIKRNDESINEYFKTTKLINRNEFKEFKLILNECLKIYSFNNLRKSIQTNILSTLNENTKNFIYLIKDNLNEKNIIDYLKKTKDLFQNDLENVYEIFFLIEKDHKMYIDFINKIIIYIISNYTTIFKKFFTENIIPKLDNEQIKIFYDFFSNLNEILITNNIPDEVINLIINNENFLLNKIKINKILVIVKNLIISNKQIEIMTGIRKKMEEENWEIYEISFRELEIIQNIINKNVIYNNNRRKIIYEDVNYFLTNSLLFLINKIDEFIFYKNELNEDNKEFQIKLLEFIKVYIINSEKLIIEGMALNYKIIRKINTKIIVWNYVQIKFMKLIASRFNINEEIYNKILDLINSYKDKIFDKIAKIYENSLNVNLKNLEIKGFYLPENILNNRGDLNLDLKIIFKIHRIIRDFLPKSELVVWIKNIINIFENNYLNFFSNLLDKYKNNKKYKELLINEIDVFKSEIKKFDNSFDENISAEFEEKFKEIMN